MFNFILLNIFLIPIIFFSLDSIAKLFKLYDIPDNRKIHKRPIPLVGGLIIYTIVFLNFVILQNINLEILILSSIYFFLGLIDDVKKISATFRLISLFIFTSLYLIFFKEYSIDFIHFENIAKIYLREYSLIFTVLCILLFQNAMNMFDGINGLSGSIFLIILIFILNRAGFNYEYLLIILLLIFFLALNLNNKIFFGDAGVYFLSTYIALNIINLSNQNLIFSEEIFLIMMLPGIDMLRLFITRILNKKNPFRPDKLHLHHVILNKYNSSFKTYVLIILMYIFPIILLEFWSVNAVNLIILTLIIYFTIIFYFQGFKSNIHK